MAKKKGAKPKYDYEGKEFLSTVEELALQGFTDKEIAFSVSLDPATFSEKKYKHEELKQTLIRARSTINSNVRSKYLDLAMGRIKTKAVTSSKMKLASGKETDDQIVQTVESELPPNLNALSTWLFHHDEEWRQRTVSKIDVTTNGKDIAPNKINLEIVYNKKEDIDMQDKNVALSLGQNNT